jgi:phage-related protein
MANYGRLVVGVTADTSQMSKDIAGAANKAGSDAGQSVARNLAESIGKTAWSGLKSIGNAVATSFTVATTAAVGFGAAMVKSGLEANAMQQEQVLSFKALLGTTKAASALMDQISAISSVSIFPKGVFVDAARQMIGFGFSAKQIPDTLKAIGEAAAATGDTTGASVTSITNALGRVQTTGKFTTRTFATLGAQGINAAQLIGKQMNMTGNEVKAALTDGSLSGRKALQALATQMGITFAKSGDEVAHTWTGVQALVKKQVTGLGKIIAAPFIDPNGGGYLVTWGNDVLKGLRGIAPGVQRIMNAVTAAIGPTLNKVGPIITRFTNALATIASKGDLSALFSQLRGLAPLLAAVFVKGGGNIAKFLGPLGELIPAINPVLAAIVALVATTPQLTSAFVDVGRSLAPILPMLSQIIDQIMGALRPALSALAPTIIKIGSILGQVLGTALKSLGPALTSVARLIGVLLDAVGPLIPPLLTFVGVVIDLAAKIIAQLVPVLTPLVKGLGQILVAIEPLLPVLTLLAKVIGTVLVVALKVLVPVLTVAAKVISVVLVTAVRIVVGVLVGAGKMFRSFGKAVAATVDFIRSHWKLLVAIIGGPLVVIAALITQHWSAIRKTVSNVLASVLATVKRVFGSIRSVVSDAMGAVSSRWSTVWHTVVTVVHNVSATVLSVVRSMVSAIRSIVSNVRSALTTPFSNAVHSIGSILSSIKGRVTGAFSGASSWLVSAGEAIVHGLISGIGSLKGAVTSALLALIPGPLKKFAGKLGIGSPSKVFHGFGQDIVQGLINGVASLQGPLDQRIAGLVGVPTAVPARPASLAGAARTVRGAAATSGATINVYPRANQSETAIARATSRELGWAARTA